MPSNMCKLNCLLITFLSFTLILPGAVSSSKHSKNSQNPMIFKANANETQQISIVVGKPDGKIGPMAEGDEEDGGGGEEDDKENVDPTGYEKCQDGNICCYQFTWPGYVQDVPTDPFNATCEQLRIDRKAPDMACFDPIVYTIADGNSGGTRRGPDVIKLEAEARENNWNIYCPMASGKSCLTLKYFARGQGNAIVNETRFCGSITETISGSQLSSGCWEQKVQGYVRQVCSCTTSICNLAPRAKNLPCMFFAILVSRLVLALGVKF